MNIAIAFAAAAGCTVALRIGWQDRTWAWTAGWALLAFGLVWSIVFAGAWGLAAACTLFMIAGLAILGREGWATPGGVIRPQRAPPKVNVPRWPIEGLGRRLAVFLLVGPAGLAASILLAFGIEEAARRAGSADPDATALALIALPIAWTILATVQMTRNGPRAMILPVLLCAVAGLLLWWPF